MAKQLSDAFKNAHGQLHAQLGVAKDKKIPAAKLEKAANSDNPTLQHRAQAALNMKNARGKSRAQRRYGGSS
jgi:hypothetical protein